MHCLLSLVHIKISDIVNTQAQINANIWFVLAITGLFVYEIKFILPFTVSNVSGLSGLSGVAAAAALNQSNNIVFKSNNAIVNNVFTTLNPNTADTTFTSFLQIETLGEGLYTYGAPLLIICSIILLLAMITPIFMSGKFKHNIYN